MKTLSGVRERIVNAFEPTAQGALGLVDKLLSLACEYDLAIDWHDGQCHVRASGTAAPDEFELPLPEPVFRAVLARIAVLCNEFAQNSVSLYGGKGQLAVGCATVIDVEFANRRGDQRLNLAGR